MDPGPALPEYPPAARLASKPRMTLVQVSLPPLRLASELAKRSNKSRRHLMPLLTRGVLDHSAAETQRVVSDVTRLIITALLLRSVYGTILSWAPSPVGTG
jgi:hypothetical protein